MVEENSNMMETTQEEKFIEQMIKIGKKYWLKMIFRFVNSENYNTSFSNVITSIFIYNPTQFDLFRDHLDEKFCDIGKSCYDEEYTKFILEMHNNGKELPSSNFIQEICLYRTINFVNEIR